MSNEPKVEIVMTPDPSLEDVDVNGPDDDAWAAAVRAKFPPGSTSETLSSKLEAHYRDEDKLKS